MGAALKLVESSGLESASALFQERWRNAARIRASASPIHVPSQGFPQYARYQEIAEVLTRKLGISEGKFPAGHVGYILGAMEQLDGSGLEVARMSEDEAADRIIAASKKDAGLAAIIEGGRDANRVALMFLERGKSDQIDDAEPVV